MLLLHGWLPKRPKSWGKKGSLGVPNVSFFQLNQRVTEGYWGMLKLNFAGTTKETQVFAIER